MSSSRTRGCARFEQLEGRRLFSADWNVEEVKDKVYISAPAVVSEGTDEYLQFVVSVARYKNPPESVAVQLNFAGSATAGLDYEGEFPSSATIPAGEDAVILKAKLKKDNRVEGAEYVTGTIQESEAYIIGKGTATSEIADDPAVVSVFSQRAVGENDGTLRVLVQRSGGDLASGLTASLKAGGTASGNDYSGLPDQVSFGANQATVELFVRVVDDALTESRKGDSGGGETLTVEAVPNDSYLAGESATTTITDDSRWWYEDWQITEAVPSPRTNTYTVSTRHVTVGGTDYIENEQVVIVDSYRPLDFSNTSTDYGKEAYLLITIYWEDTTTLDVGVSGGVPSGVLQVSKNYSRSATTGRQAQSQEQVRGPVEDVMFRITAFNMYREAYRRVVRFPVISDGQLDYSSPVIVSSQASTGGWVRGEFAFQTEMKRRYWRDEEEARALNG